jgi:hypothetical protein
MDSKISTVLQEFLTGQVPGQRDEASNLHDVLPGQGYCILRVTDKRGAMAE